MKLNSDLGEINVKWLKSISISIYKSIYVPKIIAIIVTLKTFQNGMQKTKMNLLKLIVNMR